MATINVLHYTRTGYLDDVHLGGYFKLDEYYVEYKGRGVLFNVERREEKYKDSVAYQTPAKQTCTFADQPRNVYHETYGVKVHAAMDTVPFPNTFIEECYQIATMKEEMEKWHAAHVIPQGASLTKEEQDARFAQGLIAFQQHAYDDALDHFMAVLHDDPIHRASIYNVMCIYSQKQQLAEAKTFFEQLIDAGWQDILRLVGDADVQWLLTTEDAEVTRQLRRMYAQCIYNCFQHPHRKIDLPLYARIFKYQATEADLAALGRFNIDAAQPWEIYPWDL